LEEEMKKITGIFVILCLGLLGLGSITPLRVRAVDVSPIKENTSIDIKFPPPASEADAKYLGLAIDQGPFSLNQIAAEAVIMEIFSTYCPHCQREASNVNKLYELVQSKGLGDKLKIVGIGATNTDYEVKIFKRKYNIPFPLFPDSDLSMTHKLPLEALVTPYFFGLKLTNKNKVKVIYSHRGAFENPEAFLEIILKETGMN
jgi:peroxiredoxin